jgi:hypothetical protein
MSGGGVTTVTASNAMQTSFRGMFQTFINALSLTFRTILTPLAQHMLLGQ